jgi:hypothetical protein
MKHSFRFSTAAITAAIAALQGFPATAQHFKSADEAYNPGEERGYFDIIMKPYAIPEATTTYVDFFFNIPDDAPDVFHVTYGEIINSQPDHLHHFVLTGCPEKVDDELDGAAAEFDMMAAECLFPVGGWAPGADVFANTDLDTGILLGRGMGIQALQMNVHYTDGVMVNDTLKVATDGIRVHYTPDFRPYSSVQKELINVGTAPESLKVPPGESRFYLSRSCTVETNCRDASEETITMVMDFLGFRDLLGLGEDDTLTCAMVAPFCGMGEGYILRLCPASCGLCEPGPDGEVNPFIPDAYRLTAVQYHAHLLGREMYTTLIREDGDAAPELKDLQSRQFWIFDNQETIPFEFDVVKDDTIMRGTEIKIGDKIQATCVYDSTYRTEPTNFFLSTYDEMCITGARVTFETPTSLLEGGDDAALDLILQIHLLSFSCLDDASSDVYSGTLTADEDARDIWKDHPVHQSEGCRYETMALFYDALTEQIRNCGEDGCECEAPGGEEIKMCADDAAFQPKANAGSSCTGGTLDGSDSADGTTKETCEDGGGVYTPYSCEESVYWMENLSESDFTTHQFLIDNVWGPKCCGGDDHDAHDHDAHDHDHDSLDYESEDDLSSAPVRGALSAASVLAAVLVAVAL